MIRWCGQRSGHGWSRAARRRSWEGFTDHAGYFLIVNLAIGGDCPDALAGETTPLPATEPGHPLVVDYVAVWLPGPSGLAGS